MEILRSSDQFSEVSLSDAKQIFLNQSLHSYILFHLSSAYVSSIMISEISGEVEWLISS